jgi:hypothetical protein
MLVNPAFAPASVSIRVGMVSASDDGGRAEGGFGLIATIPMSGGPPSNGEEEDREGRVEAWCACPCCACVLGRCVSSRDWDWPKRWWYEDADNGRRGTPVPP